jgi:tRNA G18 (ribose-2'-O)-methylase SpoU
MNDTRNVTDEFKGMDEAEIIRRLDGRHIGLEIAIENTLRDFNMGSIVRSANAFGVRHVHVIGRRQWNKRGAMATDHYLHMHHHSSVNDFVAAMQSDSRPILAIDNLPGSMSLRASSLPERCVMVFGQEGPGLSEELAQAAQTIIAIEQSGSTRSLTVAAAAAVAMYEWHRRFD